MAGSAGISALASQDLVAVDCDLLVPAALEGMIHEGNAARDKASVVLELVNGPLTPEADAILDHRGTAVPPYILADVGRVTVLYFEWDQNRQGYNWSIDDVHAPAGDDGV